MGDFFKIRHTVVGDTQFPVISAISLRDSVELDEFLIIDQLKGRCYFSWPTSFVGLILFFQDSMNDRFINIKG
ncbi:hypothetical protein A3Q56_08128 [Intoshia linei]|uniref:Uncharacterized protein n=1 Tax=Intoshia linei TaxID=1819745 RepID=A0A177ASE7_9BILA|nr:hypothetical protein A3Q56_08128 [Intoshia linei]